MALLEEIKLKAIPRERQNLGSAMRMSDDRKNMNAVCRRISSSWETRWAGVCEDTKAGWGAWTGDLKGGGKFCEKHSTCRLFTSCSRFLLWIWRSFYWCWFWNLLVSKSDISAYATNISFLLSFQYLKLEI